MISYRSIAMLCGAAMLAACGEDAVQQISAPATGANVKFFNFAVATPPITSAPGVNFFANDQKVTAISSTTGAESTTGTATGAVASGGLYSQVAPGSYTLSGRVAAAVDNGLAIAKSPATALDAGKYYSFYMSGYWNATTKTTDAFVVEDAIPATIDNTLSYVRFVNAAVNGTAASSPLTLYAKNTVSGVEVPVGGAVAYKGAGAFVTLPGAVYDLSIRSSGSATNVAVATGASFLPGRVLTVTAFGDVAITTATATNRIRLTLAANR
jgi:hypothetical protein